MREPARLWRARKLPSILGLLCRLLYTHIDRKQLLGAAVPGPPQRGCSQIVEPDGDAHMRIGRADGIRRIEADPAELGDVDLGPGVSRFLLVHAITAMKVAAHVAGGNSQPPRGGDKDMREVL